MQQAGTLTSRPSLSRRWPAISDDIGETSAVQDPTPGLFEHFAWVNCVGDRVGLWLLRTSTAAHSGVMTQASFAPVVAASQFVRAQEEKQREFPAWGPPIWAAEDPPRLYVPVHTAQARFWWALGLANWRRN